MWGTSVPKWQFCQAASIFTKALHDWTFGEAVAHFCRLQWHPLFLRNYQFPMVCALHTYSGDLDVCSLQITTFRFVRQNIVNLRGFSAVLERNRLTLSPAFPSLGDFLILLWLIQPPKNSEREILVCCAVCSTVSLMVLLCRDKPNYTAVSKILEYRR